MAQSGFFGNPFTRHFDLLIIAKGEIAAEGTPEALRRQTGYENLEDAFVEVIGSGEGLE